MRRIRYRYQPNLGRLLRGTPIHTNLDAKGGLLFLFVPAWNKKLVQSSPLQFPC